MTEKFERLTVGLILERDLWSIGSGILEGARFSTRFRQEFAGRPDVSALPRLVRVAWEFDAGANDEPAGAQLKAMAVFENRLASAVEEDLVAVLAAVITHRGRRTWVFYCADIQVFAERLHHMPQERDPYPIKIETKNDPGWTFLYETVIPKQD
ncbi:MAG: DUF695 domain-containing protein [Archangium sp.]|nr:DUF695 domain-containing protein [Archangium sp.]MDP3155562.1 DUF695 domain-containing protein [Archangium sp.]MDP3570832.1 DUF695 domain-containing protein [Archangium sp.]